MKKYAWAAAYVSIIITVNVFFGWGSVWPNIATVLVGVGFLVRDLAQRDLGDKVLYATGIGVLLSFALASPGVAVPSAIAFGVSETADWFAVRQLQDRPMWQRMLVSHLISVPLDSALFLGGLVFGIGLPWSWGAFAAMTSLKMSALVIIWLFR